MVHYYQSNTCSFSTIFNSRLSVIAPSSCWSGFVAPSPGWRTGPQRTPCRPCSRNWRISGTTAACTSPPRSKKSANLRSISTPCRPSCGSAIGQPSCPLKGKWSRWVGWLLLYTPKIPEKWDSLFPRTWAENSHLHSEIVCGRSPAKYKSGRPR